MPREPFINTVVSLTPFCFKYSLHSSVVLNLRKSVWGCLKNSSPTKTYSNYTNIRIIERGNRVPLEDGSIIYFSYQIRNLPKDKTEMDGFKIRLTFPEITNPSGE